VILDLLVDDHSGNDDRHRRRAIRQRDRGTIIVAAVAPTQLGLWWGGAFAPPRDAVAAVLPKRKPCQVALA
jgi:hypothetical protein